MAAKNLLRYYLLILSVLIVQCYGATGTINTGTRYQEIEGFGAAGAWYENYLTSNSKREELYDLFFDELGIDIYRVRNTYDYDSGYMSNTGTIVGEALERNPNLKILISSWSPPGSLKSNGDTSGGGNATLAGGPSSYVYSQFADWWADSITSWSGYGVDADYISIQNECDYDASWDSCRFDPTENSSVAGYNQAFEAVYSEVYSRFGSSMPKMIAPEATGFNGASGYTPSQYLSALSAATNSHVYGYCHHLYNINAGDNPDSYISAMQSFKSSWSTKPRFQTEYEKATDSWPDAYNLALLLHNSLVEEEVSGYLYWDLFWDNGGLVTLPSYGASTYTINSDYYGFKHYSAFIFPGWERIYATEDSSNLRMSAYISPGNSEMTVVIINTSSSSSVNLDLSFTGCSVTDGDVYRTTSSQNCALVGSYNGTGTLTIPVKSVTTLALTVTTGAQHTLNCSSTTGGSVTTPGEGNYNYIEDTYADIIAQADQYYHFVEWTGSAVTAGKVDNQYATSTTVFMDDDYTVVANFEANPPDTTPPSPNPMTWELEPNAISSISIFMRATTATDDSEPVEYYFECTTDGDANSTWQTDPNYTATGLLPETQYTFRVKARDSYLTPNVTGWSSSESATTQPPPPGPELEVGTVSNIGGSWEDVILSRSYNSMVVVAVANYDNTSDPAVVRIQNASGNSFQVRIDPAGGIVPSGIDVHYMVVEEGVYTTLEHGVQMEAVKYLSTVTDNDSSWVGESRTYSNSYSSPVVLGQVMTYADSDFSTFWCRGGASGDPPDSSTLYTGKTVSEDSDTTRNDETIGYIVIEAGSGTIGDINYVAGLGSNSIQGVDDSPPYSYSISGLPSPNVAIASLAGMNGFNGGWAILYGDTPLTPISLNLAIDEDVAEDTERNHTTEEVGYIVFESVVDMPPAAPQNLTAEAGNETVTLDWDDNEETDLAGYNVYRSESSGSDYNQINVLLVVDSNYVDNDVDNLTPYYYVVTAVDANSNESGYSNEATATPDYQNCDDVKDGGHQYLSDIDGDCHVDSNDLGVIVNYWLYTNCAGLDDCEGADFPPTDGDVDLIDFSDFAIDWLRCNDPEDEDCTPNWHEP